MRLWLRRYWPLLVGLLYFLNPLDLLPDTILGLGWGDDLVLMLLAYWLFRRQWRQAARRQSYGRPHGHSTNQGRYRSSAAGRKDPYEILGVSPGARPEEIKAAYRRQAQRYHPDRVSHLGEEFQELAKQRFQEIQDAYETLSRRP